ncbi:MAG: IS3 family transposase [Nitrospiraceae bacterium]
MRYAFIQTHEPAHGVTRLCTALGVSRSGYYAWQRRPVSARGAADQRLLATLRRVHQQTREHYGAVKLWRAVNASGIRCGRHRVARLRRLAGLEARRIRRFRVSVEHHQLPPPAPNRLQQHFVAPALNTIWVGDLTAVPTRAGWLYVAVLLDLYSRRVIGWAMSATPDQHVTLQALTMAVAQRPVRAGLIHHSDQGAQYSSLAYRHRLTALGLTPSMSRKGNCYDNAVAESFFSTLKNELIHERTYQTRDEASQDIFAFIEGFYNRQRLHQSLGYLSPLDFERRLSDP